MSLRSTSLTEFFPAMTADSASTEVLPMPVFISFTGSRVITLILDTLLMILFVKSLNMNDMIAKVIVQIVVIIGNYLISKLFVFKK